MAFELEDNTYRVMAEQHTSRSMNHSDCASGTRKCPMPFEEEPISHLYTSYTTARRQSIPSGINQHQKSVTRPDSPSEFKLQHQHINKRHYWKPSHTPPSPPQEKAAMTILPSFSTLSDIAGTGPSSLDLKASIQSPKKCNSLDSFHYPPTPPLSLASRSLPGKSSSPLLSAPRAFLKPPTQPPTALAPMYHCTAADVDTKPQPQPKFESGLLNSEHERFVSPPVAKRQCLRSSPENSLPDYSSQNSHANELRRTQQLSTTQPNKAYSTPVNINQQPLNPFYSTMTTSIGFEHHHYISPSSASCPLQQERYNCPECGRAFSRPSSLKIHTYSHTGEKPFYCPVRGCNKNFSVRSNMKRHERGCHARKK